ncbi:MAG: flavodoxin [Actinobacteria bacterium]|uniref:Unannotated protein n=1 Tax=freshwater metagenome TaxID=449393 RepID=A0A6J7D1Z4_9ZZZZ|nr:flavodoxin [Actinomycetota bacterium]
MHALLVFESMFGNTLEVANAVAAGIAEATDGAMVDVAEVGTLPAVGPDVDLLVVGGPTHAFGMSRPTTRQSARDQMRNHDDVPAGVVSEGIGVREWLDQLPAAHAHLLCAAFDTRVSSPRVPGSAAHGMAKRLRHKGYAEASEPHTFWVAGTEGPVIEGEISKAREWGRSLAISTRSHRW